MSGEREADSDVDELRAHVRMRLAFWQAQDRRSITNGPTWLWRGQHAAPLRLADLSTATAELIAHRRRAGMPAADSFGAAGPRQSRLPRWATSRSAAYWGIAAVLLALVGLVCARATDDRARVGVLAGWGAVASIVVAVTTAGLLVWALRDPLRLTPAQRREVNTARRVLDWNPLAGEGPITAGGGYVLEGISVVSALTDSPAWSLPGVDVLRARFDADEEIFQIARAAYSLDLHDEKTAEVTQLVRLTGIARTAVLTERRMLTSALLNRLVALHRCVATLDDILQRARQLRAGTMETSNGALFGAAAENELAAEAVTGLNTDLLAMVGGYDEVGSFVRDPGH